ncbi:hypothetical protein I8752_10645 [Nostocaceae cyanobacterium CENA369]|uniref:Uncharacterized protein n=1 Tax=Dendronalium phyllosphericum CENA369 TaxID=1725256 RepID=A0A8J7I023_9NOST|nr:hypothetical protein [Dendronalium phyllosphericum]MBH8573465.1 hypothetical protein [Dendronalium phyllosphericum CENA369]
MPSILTSLFEMPSGRCLYIRFGYCVIDEAPSLEAGTTHQKIDRNANFTDGKHVYEKAVRYYQQQKVPSKEDTSDITTISTSEQVALL